MLCSSGRGTQRSGRDRVDVAKGLLWFTLRERCFFLLVYLWQVMAYECNGICHHWKNVCCSPPEIQFERSATIARARTIRH